MTAATIIGVLAGVAATWLLAMVALLLRCRATNEHWVEIRRLAQDARTHATGVTTVRPRRG